MFVATTAAIHSGDPGSNSISRPVAAELRQKLAQGLVYLAEPVDDDCEAPPEDDPAAFILGANQNP